ncbi:MAG: alpha/beta hydrolase family protein, partial [Nocardioides sp.]
MRIYPTAAPLRHSRWLAAAAVLLALSAWGGGAESVAESAPASGASATESLAVGGAGGRETLAACDGSVSHPVGWVEGELVDAARGRSIPYRLYYPQGARCSAAVILVSHGGDGSDEGHLKLNHLGYGYANAGFLGLHIGHRESAAGQRQVLDRPADVSFVIDALTNGSLAMPAGFHGGPDLNAIGHTGHSFGAYTSHAVAGAVFTHGSFTDARVRAIAPISPQGPDMLGAFDNGPVDNSWHGVPLPAYNLVGGLEKDGDRQGGVSMPNWRLYPSWRYGDAADRFLSVLPGQDHNQMGNHGSAEIKAFIAINTRVFFDAYLRGRQAVACSVGTRQAWVGVYNAQKAAAAGSLIDR